MSPPTLLAASVAAVARAELGGGLLPEDVSPGVIGFLVTLALVLACIPLFRSMTGKLRGVQHRALPEEPGDAAAPDDRPPRHAPVTPADDDGPGPAPG
jgi:hypothetical protein